MRRAALLLPLWLALTVGEHSVVHQCPTHAMPDPAPGAPVAPIQHGGSHGHHADVPAPGDGHGEHGEHGCLCIDACSTSTVAVTSVAPTAPGAGIAFATARPAPAPRAASRPNRQLRLPWANGPPVPANIG